MVGLVMRANHDVVERKAAFDDIMHPVQFPTGLVTAGKSRLVGGYNEDKTGGFQLAQTWFGRLVYLELLHGQWGDLILRSRTDLVEDSVTLYEYGSLHIKCSHQFPSLLHRQVSEFSKALQW